ncbi:MAG: arginase, partial [Polaromonas sp.]
MKTINLIGAPTDIGASVRGAGLGPDALRVVGLPQALRNRQL